MRVSNTKLEINIESGDDALSTTERAASEIKKALQKVIDSIGDDAPIEGCSGAFLDSNGNGTGDWCLDFEEMDWISDWDEWIEHCKEYIKENGFYLEQESTTVYEWDTLAELDETALSEWFSNYTDSAVTREEVCPEARNWGWDSE
nr:hypothetical protein [Alteromonas macleodii]|tara:strand:+ start:14043 stop:14480 length:438 start_codon:yes stop_codon:yes gene_type:complete